MPKKNAANGETLNTLAHDFIRLFELRQHLDLPDPLLVCPTDSQTRALRLWRKYSDLANVPEVVHGAAEDAAA